MQILYLFLKRAKFVSKFFSFLEKYFSNCTNVKVSENMTANFKIIALKFMLNIFIIFYNLDTCRKCFLTAYTPKNREYNSTVFIISLCENLYETSTEIK